MSDPTRTAAFVQSAPEEPHTREDEEREEYAWCWIACPHDPPCADAPPSKHRSDPVTGQARDAARVFPSSVALALAEHDLPPEFRADDDLDRAQADYDAALSLWRLRNGHEGGLEAFDLLVASARRLRDLRSVT